MKSEESPEAYRLLMDYALKLLGQRRYTIKGLSKKLNSGAIHSMVIQNVIDRLCELGYLNDLDYAQSFVEERCRLKPRGKALLTQELQQRGVPKPILDQFWTQASLDETLLALNVANKKLPRLKGKTLYEKRQKLFTFLCSKGFSLSVSRNALDKALPIH